MIMQIVGHVIFAGIVAALAYNFGWRERDKDARADIEAAHQAADSRVEFWRSNSSRALQMYDAVRQPRDVKGRFVKRVVRQ